MSEADHGEEVSVVYDASDLRSLYGACRQCRRILILVLVLPIFFGLTSTILDGYRGRELALQISPYVVIAIIVAASMYLLSPVLQLRARRKNGWERPILFRLSETEVASSHPAQSAQFPWSAIKKVARTQERLFIFTTPASALILPRRCFDSESQFEHWAQRADTYWRAAHGSQEAV